MMTTCFLQVIRETQGSPNKAQAPQKTSPERQLLPLRAHILVLFEVGLAKCSAVPGNGLEMQILWAPALDPQDPGGPH